MGWQSRRDSVTQGRMPYINLLPWRQTQQQARRRQFIFFIAIGMLAVGLFCFGGDRWAQGQIAHYRKVKDELVHTQNQLKSQLIKLEGYFVSGQIQNLNELSLEPNKRYDQFMLVIHSLPAGMKFTRIQFSSKMIQLSGLGKAKLLESWVSEIKTQITNARIELVDMQSHGGDLKWNLNVIWENKISPE